MESLLEKAVGQSDLERGSSPSDEQGQLGISHSFIHENPSMVENSRISRLTTPVPAGDDANMNEHDPTATFSSIADFRENFMSSHEPVIYPTRPPPSWKGGMALGPFSLPSFQELPTRNVALELVEETFRSFNAFVPLFDKEDFMQQFHHHYLTSSPSNPAWWACINVVLCLAHRYRAMRTLETSYENTQSCGYIHNAIAVVSELNVLYHSLPAIQALVGIAFVLQGTPNPRPSSVLIATAVRLAQAMGLHRKSQDVSITEAEREQRRRVFWIAYFLDKDISLRMGLPFVQDDDDMDAELPKWTLSDLQSCSRVLSIDVFNSRIGLAVIQGQIYKRLYSVQATRQSAAQKSDVAQELSSLLSYWRSSVPIDFEDDQTVSPEAPLTVEFIHMFILRFTYVNCLVMIDRYLQPTVLPTVDEMPETHPAVATSESLCIAESRKAISLIRTAPLGDYAIVWTLLHPAFAAVTALLENVLRHPASSQATSDLHIVEPFLRLVEILAADDRQCSRSEEGRWMHQVSHSLSGRAQEAVDRLNKSIMA